MELPSLNSGRLISIYEFTYTPEIFLRIVPKSKTKTYKTFPQKILYYMIAILYYLSFVPFRFQNIWNSKTGYFDVRLYSNGFQKVKPLNLIITDKILLQILIVLNLIFKQILCAAMHIILLTLTVHLLFATFGPDEQGNIYANSILDSTLVLVGSGMIWYFIYTVWFDQTHFLFLAQMDTLDTHKFAKHKYNIKDRIQNCIATVIPVILLMSSLYQFCIANLNSKYVSYTVQFWFKMLFVFQLVLFNFPEDIFIVTALRLRDRAQLFLDNNFNSRDIENRITTSTIIREYYELDDFVNELNDKFGFWLLIHMVVGIPYLSQKSVEFFKGSTSFISVLLNIPVMFAHIFFLFVAASVTQKVIE